MRCCSVLLRHLHLQRAGRGYLERGLLIFAHEDVLGCQGMRVRTSTR